MGRHETDEIIERYSRLSVLGTLWFASLVEPCLPFGAIVTIIIASHDQRPLLSVARCPTRPSRRASPAQTFPASVRSGIAARYARRTKTGVLDSTVMPEAVQIFAPISSARIRSCSVSWLGLPSGPLNCRSMNPEARRDANAVGFVL